MEAEKNLHFSFSIFSMELSLSQSSTSSEIQKSRSFPSTVRFNIPPDAIKKLEEVLQLTFVNEEEIRENLCMANNEELIPAFRSSFSQKDIIYYLFAMVHSSAHREQIHFQEQKAESFPMPADAEIFWKMAKLGKPLRRKFLVTNYRKS